jgi:hypothetical protein
MKNLAKTGCAALALSLLLAVPALAQQRQSGARTPQTPPAPCGTGTVGGKCLDPAVFTSSVAWTNLLANHTSRTIPPWPVNREYGKVDPYKESNKYQPQTGFNGTTGITGAGSPNFIYGRY